MDFQPLFFVNSALLGLGLAMDAFSVSLADGFCEPNMSLCKHCAIAGTFAAFQAFMPLLGWVCVHTIVKYFQAFERFIPWVALILLSFIGGKMLYEAGHSSKADEEQRKLGYVTLIVQGVATSIDALSVGFTIATYGAFMAIVCAFIIACVTFVVCAGGLTLGRKFGTRLSGRASILGGIILILIGFEIFISSFFG